MDNGKTVLDLRSGSWSLQKLTQSGARDLVKLYVFNGIRFRASKANHPLSKISNDITGEMQCATVERCTALSVPVLSQLSCNINLDRASLVKADK